MTMDIRPSSRPIKRSTEGSFRREWWTGVLSLALAVVLLSLKFAAYFLTRSNAIFSDAMETVVNVVGASFALYSISLAHRPADKEHPYGHGKIEFFSAGLEGGMILLAALVIGGKVAMAYVIRGSNYVSDELDGGMLLMFVALILNGGAAFYLRRAGRLAGSVTLEASGVHLAVDAVTSAVVLGCVVLVRITGWAWIDSIGALLLALNIAIQGLRLIKTSAGGLMDEQDAGDQKLLRQILDSHVGLSGKTPSICSYHKLRHRHSGRYHWVDFHMMVPGHWNIEKGHRVASSIEYEIELALGEGNATAHVEPCDDAGCEHCAKSPREAMPGQTPANAGV